MNVKKATLIEKQEEEKAAIEMEWAIKKKEENLTNLQNRLIEIDLEVDEYNRAIEKLNASQEEEAQAHRDHIVWVNSDQFKQADFQSRHALMKIIDEGERKAREYRMRYGSIWYLVAVSAAGLFGIAMLDFHWLSAICIFAFTGWVFCGIAESKIVHELKAFEDDKQIQMNIHIGKSSDTLEELRKNFQRQRGDVGLLDTLIDSESQPYVAEFAKERSESSIHQIAYYRNRADSLIRERKRIEVSIIELE